MQPLIIDQVARDRKLIVRANDETYVRRGLIGCTRDAEIICPDRGPGALEIKCVFDYRVWVEKWGGGEGVPREIEIQLQAQMYTGTGEEQFAWGLIAVWVCAQMYYFERKPITDLWLEMTQEAADFFDAVAADREPDAFGAACEAPFIRGMFPGVERGTVLDLSNDPDHVKTSEDVSMYKTHKEIATGSGAVAEGLRIKLLALAREYEYVKLPCGVSYRIKSSGKGKSVVPYVPEHPSAAPPPRGEPILAGG